jgi:hypothetical protein
MSLRKKAKKVARRSAKIKRRVFKVAAPALQLAGAAFLGPAGAAAASALSAAAGRYIGATAARAKGERGREARAEGRKLMKYAAKTGAVITAGSALISAVGGGGLTEGVLKTVGILGKKGVEGIQTPGIVPGQEVPPEEAAGEEPMEEEAIDGGPARDPNRRPARGMVLLGVLALVAALSARKR